MKRQLPYGGETRIVKRFALFPVKTDAEWAWLEVVYILQVFSGRYQYWQNNEFVSREKWLEWREQQ